MKRIVKSKEPHNLKKYRKSFTKRQLNTTLIFKRYPYASQEDCVSESTNLRKRLLIEQGYICCYCMNIISCEYSKIEHFNSQTNFRGQQLDYNNMFLACCGIAIDKSKFKTCKTYDEEKNNFNTEQFCDTYKADKSLKHINLLSNIEKVIIYKKDGEISSPDKNIIKELNDDLNLNTKVLKTDRENTYKQLDLMLNFRV